MKRLVIILFLTSICFGDVYTSHQLPLTNNILNVGSDELFWHYFYGTAFTDGTAYWESNRLYGFNEIAADTLTDGTFIVSGGIISAGTWQGSMITVPYGGTGATSLTDGGILLGSGTSAITAMSVLADGEFIVGDGTTDPIAESGNTARTSLGLGTGNSPTFAGLTVTSNSVFGLNSSVFQPAAGGDSTTFFQIKNAAGAIVGNFDTENIRFGIGTATPNGPLHIKGVGNRYGTEAVLFSTSDFILNTTGSALAIYFGADTGDTRSRIQAVDIGGNSVARLTLNELGGNVGIAEPDPETLLEMTSTAPRLTFHNSTHENTDGGRESRIIFKGEKTDESEHTLGMQEFSHDGTGDNFLAKYTLSLNKNAGADTLSDILTATQDSFVVQAPTDSTTFFQIKDVAGTQVIGVDTTNERVIIGVGNPATLLQVGSSSSSGDQYITIDAAAAQQAAIQWSSAGAAKWVLYRPNNSDDLVLNNVDGEKVRFQQTTGNLGLNTGSPDDTLQVVGTAGFGDDADNETLFASDGTLTMAGTARVLRDIRIGAGSWKIGSTAPTAAISGNFPTLTFANGQNDAAHYEIIVPYRRAADTHIHIVVEWYYEGAQDDGAVEWNLTYLSCADGENPEAAGTNITKTSAGTHTTDLLVTTEFTEYIDSANIENGEPLGMKLWRDGTNDANGKNVKLIAVHLHFTMDKLGKNI